MPSNPTHVISSGRWPRKTRWWLQLLTIRLSKKWNTSNQRYESNILLYRYIQSNYSISGSGLETDKRRFQINLYMAIFLNMLIHLQIQYNMNNIIIIYNRFGN